MSPPASSSSAPPLALRMALRERYRGTFVDGLRDANAAHAREHGVGWTERHIERAYDARYARDVKALWELSTGGDDDDNDDDRASPSSQSSHPSSSQQSFDGFVFEWCGRSFGVRALIEKRAWELMCNAEAGRKSKTSECCELFCAFVRGGYDEEALLFFLYCRRWAQATLSDMVKRGERVTSSSVDSSTVADVSGINLCEMSLDVKQALTIVRLIFVGSEAEGVGGTSSSSSSSSSFLHATVRAMIDDAFNTDWATAQRATTPKKLASNTEPVRMDVYRLLKMLLSVFVDTTPPANAGNTPSKTQGLEAAMNAVALDDATGTPLSEQKQTQGHEAPPPPAPIDRSAEIARYELAVRAALADAASKYAAAVFPAKVPRATIADAETELNAAAQDLLTRIIDNASADGDENADIVNEAPAACKAYARARSSLLSGAGTPGSESPAMGSSTRDIARALLATPKMRQTIEPLLKNAVEALKSSSSIDA